MHCFARVLPQCSSGPTQRLPPLGLTREGAVPLARLARVMAVVLRPLSLSVLFLCPVLVQGCGDHDDPSDSPPIGTLYVRHTLNSALYSLDPSTAERRLVEDLPVTPIAVVAAPLTPLLALVDGGDLYAFDLGSRDLTSLLSLDFAILNPALSQSGQRIAYTTAEPEGHVLRVRHLATGQEQVFEGVTDVHLVRRVSWLGDTALVFLKTGPDGALQPWQLRVADERLEPLLLPEGPEVNAMSASRHGRYLALYRRPTGSEGYDISVFDFSTGTERSLVAGVQPSLLDLAWSPDDSYLATTATQPGPTVDALLVDVASGKTQILRNDEADEFTVTWAVDP